MKRRIVRTNKHNYLEERYNSFEELISTIEKRERVNTDNNSMNGTEERFKGVEYDKAKEWLLNGYSDNDAEKMISEVKAEISKFKRELKQNGIAFQNDIVGFAPNVPNAVMGVPNNMIKSVRVPKRKKVISIIVDMGVDGGTSQNQYLERGVKIIKKVIELESKGYRVRLEYMNTYNSGDRHDLFRVLLKSESQPLDIKRIAFPLLRKEMERRIGFSWKERLEGSLIGNFRYGGALQNTEILKPLMGENEYAIRFYDDIDVILKDVA